MTQEEYERFNQLSEKVLSQKSSLEEENEFHKLLRLWNDSVEFNIVNSIYMKNFTKGASRSPSFDVPKKLTQSIRYYD